MSTWACSVCSKNCGNKQAAITHILNVHTNAGLRFTSEDIHHCTNCRWSFVSEEDLLGHYGSDLHRGGGACFFSFYFFLPFFSL